MSGYKAVRASYADAIDMLYVLCKEGASLSSCDSLEDTPSGFTVMYDGSGSVLGVEVSDFAERFQLPASIPVDAKTPFVLDVDEAEGLVVA